LHDARKKVHAKRRDISRDSFLIAQKYPSKVIHQSLKGHPV